MWDSGFGFQGLKSRGWLRGYRVSGFRASALVQGLTYGLYRGTEGFGFMRAY